MFQDLKFPCFVCVCPFEGVRQSGATCARDEVFCTTDFKFCRSLARQSSIDVQQIPLLRCTPFSLILAYRTLPAYDSLSCLLSCVLCLALCLLPTNTSTEPVMLPSRTRFLCYVPLCVRCLFSFSSSTRSLHRCCLHEPAFLLHCLASSSSFSIYAGVPVHSVVLVKRDLYQHTSSSVLSPGPVLPRFLLEAVALRLLSTPSPPSTSQNLITGKGSTNLNTCGFLSS